MNNSNRITFNKYMITDLDIPYISSESYLLAKNFTVGDNSDPNFIGALTNVKGNILSTTLNSDYTILNSIVVGSYLVLFVVDVNDNSLILRLSTSGNYEHGMTVTTEVVYSDEMSASKLGFNTTVHIDLVGRYENETNLKVYFAIPGKILKLINVYNLYTSVEADHLDIVPNQASVLFNEITIFEGGSLTAGRIQYCVKYHNKYGTETLFSNASIFINLSESSITNTNFTGSNVDANTGKSVNIPLSEINQNFDYINLYSIHYTSYNTPIIKLVARQEIVATTALFVDSGTYLDTVTLSEFSIFGGRVVEASTIESKDNYLFAANIVEKNQDLDIDCRAYRFKKLPAASHITFTLDAIPVDTLIESYVNKITITLSNGNILRIVPSDKSAYVTEDEEVHIPFIGLTDSNFFYAAPTAIHMYYGTSGIVSTNNISIANSCASTTVETVGDYLRITYIPDSSEGYPAITKVECPTFMSYTINNPYSYTSILYEQDGTYYKIATTGNWTLYNADNTATTTTGTNFIIPKTADCINKYNDEFLNDVDNYGTTLNKYKYCYDAYGQLGGTGRIISYTFDTNTIQLSMQHIAAPSNTYYSFYNKGGFKRDEVYRFGIVFFDLKGKPYPAKWIGDIRIPTITPCSTGSDSVDAYNVGIIFSINTSNIDSNLLQNISGYKIVRVDRTDTDKSIIAQGVTWASFRRTDLTGDPVVARPFPHLNSSYTTDYRDFIHYIYSPELFYNKGISFDGDSYRVKVVGVIKDMEKVAIDDAEIINGPMLASTVYNSTTHLCYPKDIDYTDGITVRSTGKSNNIVPIGSTFTIADSKKLSTYHEKSSGNFLINAGTGAEAEESITRFHYKNRVNTDHSSYSSTRMMYNASCGIFTTNERLYKSAFSDSDCLSGVTYIIDIYKNNAAGRYGGTSYENRSVNNYITASEYSDISSSSVITSFGDSYIGYYECLNSMFDNSDGTDDDRSIYGADIKRRQVVTRMPVESNINLYYVNIKPSEYVLNVSFAVGYPIDNNRLAILETYAKGVAVYGSSYSDYLTDLNQYNNAYSSKSYYPLFPAASIFGTYDSTFPNMVIVSERKYNDELVDNWSKFLFANTLEVDSNYGNINALKRLDNRLFVWQDNAFGEVSANDRFLVQGDATQLSLGSGSILERYDYVSTEFGCDNKYQITNDDNALYWANNKLKSLFRYNGDLVDLGLESGNSSYIRSTYLDTCKLYYDMPNKELLITNSNDEVFVYNSIAKSFIGTYTYKPLAFIKLPDKRLATTGDGYSIYKHSVNAHRGSFYGIVSPSYVKLVDSKDNSNIKVFDTISWNSTSTDQNGVNIYEDTFYEYRCYNDYQNTDWQTIEKVRKEREFHAIIPRDRVKYSESQNQDIFNVANLDDALTIKRRMRDRYLIIELRKGNTSNYNFKFPYLIVNSRYSIR